GWLNWVKSSVGLFEPATFLGKIVPWCKADFDRFKGTSHKKSDKTTTAPNQVRLRPFPPPAIRLAARLGMSHFVTDSLFFVANSC
ncbi:MAG TPA: hypothetical protein VG269_23505, partial [Tepidisphaeraceae bacterium]|nr:hypothetical protein [Tepidisphaeraceae bacterium]